MLIAQISDTHILAKSSDRPEAGPRADDLRRCVADINRLDPLPDLVIHTGDTVQTGVPADYAHLRKLLASLRMPLFPAPGNRDNRANFRAAFEPAAADEPFLHYTVDEFPVRLVALDSIDPAHNQGVYCAGRQRWLDASLSAAPDRPTILFIHHPPFDVGPRYIDGYRDPADRAALTAIVARHRQVRRLLCGHCHRSSQRIWADTQATTMPSIARDVREGIDAQSLAGTSLYQLHAVSKDGAVATQTRLVLD
jgi:3',5'-cyclic AMP phosphodiesterase CpdA